MKIINKNCCGCSACENICPVNAVKLELIDGFYQARINEAVCINCGLCSKVCFSETNFHDLKAQKVACFSAKDENILNCSQSGGAFAVISSALLLEGYKIYGVILNKDTFKVEHSLATSLRQLHDMFGSKYVQSYLGSTFKNIKDDLLSGKKVLFSGTPCQVDGLNKYLRYSNVDTLNLLTMEIICLNVSSPLGWHQYLKKYQKYGLLYVNCRDKRYGWRSNRQTYITQKKGAITNGEYAMVFNSYIFSNEPCFDCKFHQLQRASDITIGDFWGIENSEGTIKNNTGGNSIVLLNTDKGKEMVRIFSKHHFEFVPEGSTFWQQKAITQKSDRPKALTYKIRKRFGIKPALKLFVKVKKIRIFYYRVLGKGKRILKKIIRLLIRKK